MKFFAYTLTDYHRVVHLDTDALVSLCRCWFDVDLFFLFLLRRCCRDAVAFLTRESSIVNERGPVARGS